MKLQGLLEKPEVQLATELKLQRVEGDGVFDYTTLEWVECIHYVGKERKRALALEALIPAADVARFEKGERARCNVDKWRRTCVQPDGAFCMYNCPCGGKAAPLKLGPRKEKARGTAKKGSKKVGCTARFSVKRTAGGDALITYLNPVHVDACRVQSPRRVCPAAKERAYAALLRQPLLSVVQLVEQNAAWVANAYAQQNGCTPAEAIMRFHAVRIRTLRARAARGARSARGAV
jgi:hypothetical protein